MREFKCDQRPQNNILCLNDLVSCFEVAAFIGLLEIKVDFEVIDQRPQNKNFCFYECNLGGCFEVAAW